VSNFTETVISTVN